MILIENKVDVNKIDYFGFEIYPFDWYDMESERGAINLADIPYEVRRELARQILKYPSNLIKKIANVKPEEETEEAE